jgi:hypothetical protein
VPLQPQKFYKTLTQLKQDFYNIWQEEYHI